MNREIDEHRNEPVDIIILLND